MNNMNMKLKLARPVVNWILLLILLLFLQWPPGCLASGNVTLESIEIFKTHEWIRKNPTIYFQCKGENKNYLPDVTIKNNVYTFKGEESWQPLTSLTERKCKRCGFYEEDMITSDDTFDEWELCPDDFSPAPEGRYKHDKENEINATFLCSQCNSYSDSTGTMTKPGSPNSTASDDRDYKSKLVIFILSIAAVFILALVIFLYGVWQKRKREEEQARFLKLFEDDDDLEIELGLRDEL